MKRRLFLLVALMSTTLSIQAGQRDNFDTGWLFMLGDSAQMSSPTYNDSHWRQLNLPHDWAVEGDFMASNPSGAGGGALPGGVGWYRKKFKLSCDNLPEDRYFIEFDGVYMNATVYINGHKLGTRPYGYSSFEYEITPYLNQDVNVIAVRVDNSDQPNSRWYSGCGIYRHVWLTQTNKVRVNHWGVYVKTNARTGEVTVETDVDKSQQPAGSPAVTVRNTVFDADGREVGLKVRKPRLWSTTDRKSTV